MSGRDQPFSVRKGDRALPDGAPAEVAPSSETLRHRAALARYYVERFRKAPPRSRDQRPPTAAGSAPDSRRRSPAKKPPVPAAAAAAAKDGDDVRRRSPIVHQAEFPSPSVLAAVDLQRAARPATASGSAPLSKPAEAAAGVPRRHAKTGGTAAQAAPEALAKRAKPAAPPEARPAEQSAAAEAARGAKAEDDLRRRLRRLQETMDSYRGRNGENDDPGGSLALEKRDSPRDGPGAERGAAAAAARLRQQCGNDRDPQDSPPASTLSQGSDDASSAPSGSRTASAQKSATLTSLSDVSRNWSDNEEEEEEEEEEDDDDNPVLLPGRRRPRARARAASSERAEGAPAARRGAGAERDDDRDASLVRKAKEVLERCGELRGSAGELRSGADALRWKANVPGLAAVAPQPGAKSAAGGAAGTTAAAPTLPRDPQQVIDELRRRYGLIRQLVPHTDGRTTTHVAPPGDDGRPRAELAAPTSTACAKAGVQNAAAVAASAGRYFRYNYSGRPVQVGVLGSGDDAPSVKYSLPPLARQAAADGGGGYEIVDGGFAHCWPVATMTRPGPSDQLFVGVCSSCRTCEEPDAAEGPALESSSLRGPRRGNERSCRPPAAQTTTRPDEGAAPPDSDRRNSGPMSTPAGPALDLVVNITLSPAPPSPAAVPPDPSEFGQEGREEGGEEGEEEERRKRLGGRPRAAGRGDDILLMLKARLAAFERELAAVDSEIRALEVSSGRATPSQAA